MARWLWIRPPWADTERAGINAGRPHPQVYKIPSHAAVAAMRKCHCAQAFDCLWMRPPMRLEMPRPRPLSPHLQIYRPTLTMTMSIVHRMTGVALYLGTLILTWWLLAASSGPNAYSAVERFVGSFLWRS